MENTSADSLAKELLAHCLAGSPYPERLMDDLLDGAGDRALFRIVVERLADLFEPGLCEVYADLFSEVIARRIPDLHAEHLLARYERVRRPRKFDRDPAVIRNVFVLSRVTLGADVAITSSMLDAAEQKFPNAQIYISEIDFNFWTDAKLLGSPLDRFAALARENLLPVRDRIVFIRDGQEFLPGVQAMLTPGHTQGHTGFLLTSGNQSLYLIGDLSHHHILLLERPRISFAYDLDPTKAADSRVKVLDMLSTDRTALFGYHFPWPGIGHVAREHGGFRYFPKPTRWIT